MSDTDGSDESDLVLEYFSSDGDHVFKGKGMRLDLGQKKKKKIMFMVYNSAYMSLSLLNKLKTGLMRNQIMYELTKIGFLIHW